MRERDQRITHRLLLADAGDPLAGLFAGEAQLLVAAREELLDVALAARATPACSLPTSIILDGWLLAAVNLRNQQATASRVVRDAELGASADLRQLTGAADLCRKGVELALRGSHEGKLRKPTLEQRHALGVVPQLPAESGLVSGGVA